MARPSYYLPSHARVTFSKDAPSVPAFGPFASELSEIRASFALKDGSEIALSKLPLSDFHTLRALAKRLGMTDEASIRLSCRNCEQEFSVRPCSALELGPFVDDELDDPDLDAHLDFSALHEIPGVRPDQRDPSHIRLVPRSLEQAAPLHLALRSDRPLRITSAVVSAMGIVELDAETSPKKIARLLANAPDVAYDAIIALFEDAHYPRRLDVPHSCPRCAMVEWLPVPVSREFSLEPADGVLLERIAAQAEEFPVPDDFEAIVREEADRAYAAAGVREIDLSVIEGAAECDDGGEPLLGCYRPPDPDALVPSPAEIRVFYRTFANMWADEGPFDVRGEIAETLRHEIEHHLGHLAGTDPVDDDERNEIEQELARRVGRSEVGRRAARAFGAEIRDFFARTWLLWVLVLAVTLLAVSATR